MLRTFSFNFFWTFFRGNKTVKSKKKNAIDVIVILRQAILCAVGKFVARFMPLHDFLISQKPELFLFLMAPNVLSICIMFTNIKCVAEDWVSIFSFIVFPFLKEPPDIISIALLLLRHSLHSSFRSHLSTYIYKFYELSNYYSAKRWK